MGRQFVDYMRQLGITPVTVNRGKKYWGRDGCPDAIANRQQHDEYRRKIGYVINGGKQTRWLGVVDFCAYSEEDITKTLPPELFDAFKFPVYILISTDSVYEVCPKVREGLVNESLTDCGEIDRKAQKRDKYGYNKLMAERALLAAAGPNQVALALRLPDVIGPFDDTLRLWRYKLWIDSGVPIYQNPRRTRRSATLANFVFSGDVVSVIYHILREGVWVGHKGAINLACHEQVTIGDLLGMIKPDFATTDDKKFKAEFLPSVDYRTQPLDLSKAVNLVKWNPTPLADAVKKTMEWLTNVAETQHHYELIQALRGLPRFVMDAYFHTNLGTLAEYYAYSDSGDEEPSSSSSSNSESDN